MTAASPDQSLGKITPMNASAGFFAWGFHLLSIIVNDEVKKRHPTTGNI